MPTAAKQLIVNADDLGLSPGVNRGIAEAHRRGIVTSATLLVNQPAAAAGLELTRGLPELGVGLHLNLTGGFPVSDPAGVPSLLNEKGAFLGPSNANFARRRDAEIRTELQAQVDAFLASGRKPTHLDSHHHIHRHPKVLEVVMELATALKIPVRPLHPVALSQAGIPHAGHFVAHAYFEKDALTRLLTDLRCLPEGTTEIMCHPGYADAELRRKSSWVEVRERELAALTDPMVRATVGAAGITLVNYRSAWLPLP